MGRVRFAHPPFSKNNAYKNFLKYMNQFEMKDLLYKEDQPTFATDMKNSVDKIKEKIYWETNLEVKRNTNIPDTQKIPKGKTEDFPAGVTVRTNNMKQGIITIYFYGDIQYRHFGNQHQWSYPESKLIVNLPSRKGRGYIFNGQAPKDMTLVEISQILDYIKYEAKQMYGKVYGQY